MGNEESRIYSLKSDTRNNKYPACYSMFSHIHQKVSSACGTLEDTIDEDSIDSGD